MRSLKHLWLAGLCLLTLVLVAPASAAAATSASHDTGILVVTPDRGFLGNQEVRDAFNDFAKNRNAALLYVTDARSEKILDARLATLRQRGAKRIVVLPLVVSEHNARWQLAKTWLDQQTDKPIITKPYGASYLAVEDLSARLREAHGNYKHLLLLGYGADSTQAAAAMAEQLQRMGGFASTLKAKDIHAVVWPQRKASDAEALQQQVNDAIAKAADTLVVPVAFAPRDDTMMDFSNWFSRKLPKGAHVLSSPLATTAALTQWMQRASNEAALRYAPVKPRQVGVIALAHGADWFWNRTIRQALAPVSKDHKLAFAFSMADQPVVERAVDQLENEHVRAIVLVRVFGKSTSFLPSVQRMLGLDVEATDNMSHGKHAGHGMMMMHHGSAMHASIAAAPRIRSALPIVTVGGVDTNPLFARALLANARSVSKHPSKETVILVAHGNGADAPNQRWVDMLENLAGQMRADGGDDFRAIRVTTWREDWPDKRKAAVAKARAMVKQAQADGGRALIVPARINGRGAADRYLKGLDYGWSQGFAQTPYLAQWFEQQVQLGIKALAAPTSSAPAASAHSASMHMR